MRRGQGTFEYVLLLGGVLLIVVLAVVLLRGGLFQSGSQDIGKQSCKLALGKAGFYDPSSVTVCTTSGASCSNSTKSPQCGATALTQVGTNLGKGLPAECTSFSAWTCTDGRA